MKYLRVPQAALIFRVEGTDHLFEGSKIRSPFRAALAVFSGIEIVDERLAKQREQHICIASQETTGKLFHQEIQKDLTARQT